MENDYIRNVTSNRGYFCNRSSNYYGIYITIKNKFKLDDMAKLKQFNTYSYELVSGIIRGERIY